jgi:pantoate--beta-alanine ligase
MRATLKRFTTPEIKKTVHEFRQYRQDLFERFPGKTIGFVPTMGYLHDGHLSLFRHARDDNDIVAASIFVNPAQFAENEDFDVYPSNFERDYNFLTKETADSMYKKEHSTWVFPDSDGQLAEGASRPGFFRGVATVVAKLFNIVQPHNAYFGQKDAQQAMIISNMVQDLNMPLSVKICPTVRESDGLAMSSRNVNLAKEIRNKASVIFTGLNAAYLHYEKLMKRNNKTDNYNETASLKSKELYSIIETLYKNTPEIDEIHYISIASKRTMEEIEEIKLNEGAIISVAVNMGNVRLIDNILL